MYTCDRAIIFVYFSLKALDHLPRHLVDVAQRCCESIEKTFEW